MNVLQLAEMTSQNLVGPAGRAWLSGARSPHICRKHSRSKVQINVRAKERVRASKACALKGKVQLCEPMSLCTGYCPDTHNMQDKHAFYASALRMCLDMGAIALMCTTNGYRGCRQVLMCSRGWHMLRACCLGGQKRAQAVSKSAASTAWPLSSSA